MPQSKGSRSSRAASSQIGFEHGMVGKERVQARETSFKGYMATENDMTLKKGAPLLLKPNGAPVFAEEPDLERTVKKKDRGDLEWAKDEKTGEWLQLTNRRNKEQFEDEVAARTVKAHNFKIAATLKNKTNIQVLDA